LLEGSSADDVIFLQTQAGTALSACAVRSWRLSLARAPRLAAPDRDTYYGGGATGYIDYPPYSHAEDGESRRAEFCHERLLV
jgi:hypothetical protein